MVYLVVYKMEDGQQSKWHTFAETLHSMQAQRVIDPYAWILESDKTAQALSLELATKMDLPHHDKLLVAEITQNSIGSYFLGGHSDASAVANLIGRARRD